MHVTATKVEKLKFESIQCFSPPTFQSKKDTLYFLLGLNSFGAGFSSAQYTVPRSIPFLFEISAHQIEKI